MERQQKGRCEGLESFLRLLGNEIKDSDDADEETYDLYAQDLPSSDLGIIDPKTTELQLTVAGRELTIHQSPGILSSARAGGTTGAGA
ncbi:Ribosomal protein lysine methyltransferase [Neurospora sp. IMI 360204]|nr:Ribosomal protein lysine methyltransferase [Neurospora sp. IMI 360204]